MNQRNRLFQSGLGIGNSKLIIISVAVISYSIAIYSVGIRLRIIIIN